jgi:hypothetical protein
MPTIAGGREGDVVIPTAAEIGSGNVAAESNAMIFQLTKSLIFLAAGDGRNEASARPPIAILLLDFPELIDGYESIHCLSHGFHAFWIIARPDPDPNTNVLGRLGPETSR